MSQSPVKHTSGRAVLDASEPTVRGDDGEQIANCYRLFDGDRTKTPEATGMANARRVAACWNACEGSSTEWLEFQTSEDMVEQFGLPEPFETRYRKALQKGVECMEQRDRLLDALQAAVDRQAYREGSGPHWWEHARAVIANIRCTP